MKRGILRSILFVLTGFLLLSIDSVYLRADQDATANDFQQKQNAVLNARKVSRKKTDSASFSVASSTQNSAAGTIVRDTATVTEANEQKVIIHGKWGTGPGEFGMVYFGEPDDIFEPLSLNVNSKGEIYILDVVNSRIQKFDKDGKYLLSIPVISMADAAGNSVVRITDSGGTPPPFTLNGSVISMLGNNIATDSKDTLYYYLIKNYGTKEAKGEIWKFRDDKLIEKYEAPVEKDVEEGMCMEYDYKYDSVEIIGQGEKDTDYIPYDVKSKSVIPQNIWDKEEKDRIQRRENGTRDTRKLPCIKIENNGVKVFAPVK